MSGKLSLLKAFQDVNNFYLVDSKNSPIFALSINQLKRFTMSYEPNEDLGWDANDENLIDDVHYDEPYDNAGDFDIDDWGDEYDNYDEGSDRDNWEDEQVFQDGNDY